MTGWGNSGCPICSSWFILRTVRCASSTAQEIELRYEISGRCERTDSRRHDDGLSSPAYLPRGYQRQTRSGSGVYSMKASCHWLFVLSAPYYLRCCISGTWTLKRLRHRVLFLRKITRLPLRQHGHASLGSGEQQSGFRAAYGAYDVRRVRRIEGLP